MSSGEEKMASQEGMRSFRVCHFFPLSPPASGSHPLPLAVAVFIIIIIIIICVMTTPFFREWKELLIFFH